MAELQRPMSLHMFPVDVLQENGEPQNPGGRKKCMAALHRGTADDADAARQELEARVGEILKGQEKEYYLLRRMTGMSGEEMASKLNQSADYVRKVVISAVKQMRNSDLTKQATA
jgi:DNA-directed RNA polymerase specialized sigma24 family protein